MVLLHSIIQNNHTKTAARYLFDPAAVLFPYNLINNKVVVLVCQTLCKNLSVESKNLLPVFFKFVQGIHNALFL